MSVKHYGLYAAWPPTVDLRSEGLGRYLAHFLKGAQSRNDVIFTIVCPSWARVTLEQLFLSEGVSKDRLHILSPKGEPYALRLFEAIRAYRLRSRKENFISRIFTNLIKFSRKFSNRLERRAVEINSLFTLFGFLTEVLFALILLILTLPFWAPFLLAKFFTSLIRRGVKKFQSKFGSEIKRIVKVSKKPQDDGLVLRLFAHMQDMELRRMQAVVEEIQHVEAWYCPTAFWPAFNAINSPRLMCVPDVVLTDFPAGFSDVGGDRTLKVFETITQAINSADRIVCYGSVVKWQTLVDKYCVPADKISVIHHAPNDLHQWISVQGSVDDDRATKSYCESLLKSAMQRSTVPEYTKDFKNKEVKFLFYASQFRPNKNIITLLRAYEWLLRRRYISHKLILTGNPSNMASVKIFIRKNNLKNDVLCLTGLSVPELAACYKLADLAVNPSLSEGGCPFTFTEALSVGTPVVMARISVTEEVLYEPELQDATFFDPYDWKDLASRVEWALMNRDKLLAVQIPVYQRLKQRSWTDVASEHIAVLDSMVELKHGGGLQ